ncbi:transposase [Streptomyces sp. NPDC101152]|uniref:transposase n=1 Tax=Streptomyces sp. NPDC101152 TaxID=3366116 RepID=UPI00381D8720
MLPHYRYPSDTSDVEWFLLEPLLPIPACQTSKGGAPEKWPRRRVVDAIRYITDNGGGVKLTADPTIMERRQVTDTAVELETVEPVESAQSGQPVPVSDDQLVAMLVERARSEGRAPHHDRLGPG